VGVAVITHTPAATSTLASRRAQAELDLWPAWTTWAACRQHSSPGAVWEDAFRDELAYKPDPNAYRWGDKARVAMQVCMSCPVQRSCLDDAFRMEHGAGESWWSGEPVEQDRRFGIRGGIPGRIREHFATHPQRVDACLRWLRAYAAAQRWRAAREAMG
jgi:hypothetical protein